MDNDLKVCFITRLDLRYLPNVVGANWRSIDTTGAMLYFSVTVTIGCSMGYFSGR